ncbi:MAG: hypothetical protein ACI92N_002346 [Pseudomonadales bacterium]|jgi:hypothetical protein
MILNDLYRNDAETVQRFSIFQPPAREGNLHNRAENKRDCQPIDSARAIAL